MVKFEEKRYASTKSWLSRLKQSYHDNPEKVLGTGANIAGIAGLGISTTNLAINTKRTKEAQEQNLQLLQAMKDQNEMNKAQLKATRDLTHSLGGVQHSLEGLPQQITPKKESPKKSSSWYDNIGSIFRTKEYSDWQGNNNQGGGNQFRASEDDILDSTIRGGLYGLAGGVGSSLFIKRVGGFLQKNPLKYVGYGLAIGSALGLLVGLSRKVAEVQSRNASNYRITQESRKLLASHGFKEGRDYTQDPKLADSWKSKAAIVVNRGNGDLKLVINYINDPKLKRLTEEIVADMPRGTKSTVKDSNRFNEVSITTVSNGRDGNFIAELCEKFIRGGYKVYLIEVG